eukprot:CAMPEP_0173110974 /NCGR_PEP_ID=MMETSP1102-20130122/44804_1 /TAXON_ID=49646 /ORGANISM="Geminigera sp., Strain Caron Lab Isolate" /LENGTH=73 /DNA_ID=CAMNT_0014011081 /DNA_START=207 /DNA_END=428 /DNA_ORIENTATION=+
MNTGSSIRAAASSSSIGVWNPADAAYAAAFSRGFSSLIQPVSTAFMYTPFEYKSSAAVRVIIFSAALAMLVCG